MTQSSAEEGIQQQVLPQKRILIIIAGNHLHAYSRSFYKDSTRTDLTYNKLLRLVANYAVANAEAMGIIDSKMNLKPQLQFRTIPGD